MKRLYEEVARRHLRRRRQMLFLVGPRQVGKTTASMTLQDSFVHFTYLNWDIVRHRALLEGSIEDLEVHLGLDRAGKRDALLVLDEIHKNPTWKDFLKGFFDAYHERVKILVTGSARLDLLQHVGDSLMGRYFLHRVHPLSVAEILDPSPREKSVRAPVKADPALLTRLLEHGGFPEPYLANDAVFTQQWQLGRFQQLFRDELKELTAVRELHQIELLGELLRHWAGQICNYDALATRIQATAPTIKKWIGLLKAFFHCYTVPPWSKNIPRALTKMPKVYLWDWAQVSDPGARLENLVASHLLKAAHHWTDSGLGHYALYYLRDKGHREVDFLMTRDEQPWLLIEVKVSTNHGVSKSLHHFQQLTGAPHALQLVGNLAYEEVDCFAETRPVIAPLITFLSQLV